MEIKQHFIWFSKCHYHRMEVAGHVLVRSVWTAELWHPLYFLSQISYLKRVLTDQHFQMGACEYIINDLSYKMDGTEYLRYSNFNLPGNSYNFDTTKSRIHYTYIPLMDPAQNTTVTHIFLEQNWGSHIFLEQNWKLNYSRPRFKQC